MLYPRTFAVVCTHCEQCNQSVHVLQEQSLVDIEMPGQYMNGDEPAPDSIVFLESISSNVHVSHRSTAFNSTILAWCAQAFSMSDDDHTMTCQC